MNPEQEPRRTTWKRCLSGPADDRRSSRPKQLSQWETVPSSVLEKPDIQDESIVVILSSEFGLDVVQIAFLPLGADQNTAVCRASADDTTDYFVKLRLGDFDEASVALPRFLSDQGVAQVMAPLLYPFIEGHNSYEASLSDDHWVEFGATLKRIHTAFAPPSLIRLIQREAYSPQWRDAVRTFLETSEAGARDDLVSVKLRGHIVFAAV